MEWLRSTKKKNKKKAGVCTVACVCLLQSLMIKGQCILLFDDILHNSET